MSQRHPVQEPAAPRSLRYVVAIAASAGGLNALTAVLSRLPSGFPAATLVVQHLAPGHPSHLAGILERHTPLCVKQAEDGERLFPGTVYIAAPDHHLLVTEDQRVSLTRTAPVSYVRPSANSLFRSLAKACGSRAIAVVLTGSGSDGADGLSAVKEAGGTVIVQDEATAQYSSMPHAAMKTGLVDYVVPLESMASKLTELVTAGVAS